MPQQSQVVAHHRRALGQILAQSSNMPLPFGEPGDDLESGRVAEMLEQVRRSLDGLVSRRGSLFTLADFVGFFVLGIVVAIGMCLQ